MRNKCGAQNWKGACSKMKRKILSVLSVLMAVILSTAVLAACEKAPAGADSNGGSGESVSTEQGGEPSVSESGAESSGESESSDEIVEEFKPEMQETQEWTFYIGGNNAQLTEISILLPKSWTVENIDAEPMATSNIGYKVVFHSASPLDSPITDTNNSYFEGLDEELIDSDLTSSGEIILSDVVGKYYFIQYPDSAEGFCQIFICKGKQSAYFYFFNTFLFFTRKFNHKFHLLFQNLI